MDRITLKNYRCFHDEQSARLAPLTLLVGDNSTGKTAFLAIIRILWDIAAEFSIPNFKEEPYDLGSFDDIVHFRGSRKGREGFFEAGFHATIESDNVEVLEESAYRFHVTFGKHWTAPVPTRIKRSHSVGQAWAEEILGNDHVYTASAGTRRGSWKTSPHPGSLLGLEDTAPTLNLISQGALRVLVEALLNKDESSQAASIEGSTSINTTDIDLIGRAIFAFQRSSRQRPFASAPVRSKPRRTYDPSRTTRDAEGDYVPMYLADISFRDSKEWRYIKEQLESFGKQSGLFDEIAINRLGRADSAPFQLLVRKFGKRLKGPWRNLVDVGYGASQALPLITEVLRQDKPNTFLLQQPEVHLHPSAQAALGSLFCDVAATGKQLIVETHSDHLMDRIRMDVRDGVSALKPEDISILFFERDELDVRIHSIRVDDEGNIRDAPEGYRQFFMEETRRSLGL